MKRLDNKVAIVTGAGSRGPGLGNGKATAILFAREGARVLCVDLAKDRADETVGLVRAEGGEAEAFAADVTRRRAMPGDGRRRRAPLGRSRHPAQQRRHRVPSGAHDDDRGGMGSRDDRRSEVDAADLSGGGAGSADAGRRLDHLRVLGRRSAWLRPHRVRRRQGRRHRLREEHRRAARTEGHPRQRDRAGDRVDADGGRPRRRRARAPAAGGSARYRRHAAGTWAGARSTWRATSRAGSPDTCW